MLIVIPGAAAALALGYIYWQYQKTPAELNPQEEASLSVAGLRLSNKVIIRSLLGLTVLLGLSGYLSIPLGYNGLRDGLVLLHTVAGGFLVPVLVAFIIPRAASMGWRARNNRQGAAQSGASQDRRTVIAFWGIVALGLVLVGTILAIMSAGVSQTGQGSMINLHSLAGFLFILMLGLLGRQMTGPE